MIAYYNDHEPFVCAWLRSLMDAGELPAGLVDRRDIAHVESTSLLRYRQCHLFAGIGGWPYALRLAGWPEDREVWTGSCPCQPFSVAGKRGGTDDPRHVWPEFLRLIAECRPATVFGEQVASPLGRGWLDGVRADLEALGYAVGAADLCAAGVGAPNIRQRLYWVADSAGERRQQTQRSSEALWPAVEPGRLRAPRGLDDTPVARRPGQRERGATEAPRYDTRMRESSGSSASGRVDDADDADDGRREGEDDKVRTGGIVAELPSAWSDFDLIPCTDGTARRVESGTFPLATRLPDHVGRLCGYGNAIVPQLAAEFVGAFLDTGVLA